MLVMVGLNF